jgi:hypothetical protein
MRSLRPLNPQSVRPSKVANDGSAGRVRRIPCKACEPPGVAGACGGARAALDFPGGCVCVTPGGGSMFGFRRVYWAGLGAVLVAVAAFAAPGDWPEPRQNAHGWEGPHISGLFRFARDQGL